MDFISLVFKGKYRTLAMVILLGLLTGGLHVGLLVTVNKMIGGILKRDSVELQPYVYAILLLLLYLILNKMLTKSMITISQRVIHDLRMLLVRSVLKLPYERLQREGETLKAAITKDTISLSHAALSSISFITSAVTVAGCLVYLGCLSIKILGVIVAVTFAGVFIYILNMYGCKRNLQQARESEDALFFNIGQVMNGFRELKINPLKSKNLIDGPLLKASTDGREYAIKGLIGYFNNGLIGQALFYLTMITLLFSGRAFFHLPAVVLMNCVIIILYLLGPLELMISMMPDIGIGNIAAARLNKILLSVETDQEDLLQAGVPDFEQLSLKAVNYTHPAKTAGDLGFKLGPIELRLDQGTVTFIYGGNGSGKTTLLHMIMGLIKIHQGECYLNNQIVGANESISTLFAPVFSDFHLFDKLYGVADLLHEKAEYYLDLFELNDKVRVDANCFSTLDLSAGQRKRLALIAALLENKPLLFLDEWAADQDPFFRTKFYTVILPILKNEGFTILAITHDDKYYHTADVLYRMEFGKLFKEK